MLTTTQIAFDKTEAHTKLKQHFAEMQAAQMKDMFAMDSQRFDKFSIKRDDFLFDYSKNRITEETMKLLLEMVDECGIEQARQNYFSGKRINETEDRAVLHTALRNRSAAPVYIDGQDVMPQINAVLAQMKRCCDDVISGTWKGYTGKAITDVVNIGIGGSDLGPVMVTEALKPFANHLKVHFVSNVDGTHIAETLKKLDAETTLFLIASKTFTTQETMANATAARNWFLENGASVTDVKSNFIALSTNHNAVAEFGIAPENTFAFWDWVGGRFSLWSAIGLSIALYIGFDNFQQLLAGAHAADKHFLTENPERNIPVIMALLGVWYRNYFDAATQAILPYGQYLHRLPAYLQQADMESNGKSVDRQGKQVGYQTGPILWGEPGTNGQHAFFQLLHQGTQIVPCDFIAPVVPHNSIVNQHEMLLANFFAQTEALMKGKTADEVTAELKAQGKSDAEIQQLLPYKIFTGNRPSNTFLLKEINPYNLGMLVAFYEHKIFVQGLLWNVNSFDQWGVELGKQMAGTILTELAASGSVSSHDASTNGLINAYKQWS